MVKIAPYGTWTSPITAAHVAAARGGPAWVGISGGYAWWAESRPAEGGRIALCRARPDGTTEEVLRGPWNVRNRVHEYGGRPWTVIDTAHGTRLAFTHWDDQRWYVLDPDGEDTEPAAISPQPQQRHGIRYADPAVSPDGRELWCVRETVTGQRPTDIVRDLVAIPLDGSAAHNPDAVRTLSASHHFLTGPKPSPDGTRVAWLGWDHPAMPWDGTQLCVAQVNPDGSLTQHRV
ncbi:MAG TPA: S9 family peptidase, partial [Pseudonocardiaceae bacterium]|nr:S9 family peptidase [Pseudonocardiaceae bacterium]